MFKKYLMATSVIFHLFLIISLIWVVPIFTQMFSSTAEIKEKLMNPEVGIVRDVKELTREGAHYIGYEIELDGETIFVSGGSEKRFRLGDEVEMVIAERTYDSERILDVTLLGVHR